MTITVMLRLAIKHLLQLLYPPACIVCRADILDNNMLCLKCWQQINFVSSPYCSCCGKPFKFAMDQQFLCGKCIANKPHFDQARYLFKFDIYSKKLIHAFKYHDQTYLAKIFANLWSIRYMTEIKKYDLIIPVPMHWFKRIQRLYNQAAILATELAAISNIPVEYDILLKTRWTKAQSSLLRAARQKNLQNSFTIAKTAQINQANIILIDDVLTTGTTTKECCKLLKQYGAANILVLTVAAT